MRRIIVLLVIVALLGLTLAGCPSRKEAPPEMSMDITPATAAPVNTSPKQQLPPPPKKEAAAPKPSDPKK